MGRSWLVGEIFRVQIYGKGEPVPGREQGGGGGNTVPGHVGPGGPKPTRPEGGEEAAAFGGGELISLHLLG